MALSRRAWLQSALAAGAPTLGLIADVQYADKPTAGARAYRDSLSKLDACARWFQAQRPERIIQLGDLTDGGLSNLTTILDAFHRLGPFRHHVLGNHDATIPRAELAAALKLNASWYDLTSGSWRLIFLDATDASVMIGALHPEEGRILLENTKAPNAQTWNGGLSSEQFAWLQRSLEAARRFGQRALVFCHQPILAEACRPEHLLLNHLEVRHTLEASGVVAAFFSGHDHRGGYALSSGIHHVTLKGLVEHPPEACATLVELRPTALTLRTMDGQSRLLPL